MPIRIGRWEIDFSRSVFYITASPDPHCVSCAGQGGIEVYPYGAPETELCDCWDPTPIVRIPLRFRRTERIPF